MNANTNSTNLPTTGNTYKIGSARQPGYQFRGDRELSTYRWTIFMTPEWSRVKGSQDKIIEGYSKDVDSSEKKDKQQLLQDCISRLSNKGYLDYCYYWVIFKRSFTHKDNDTMILELNPEGYLAHDFLTLDIATTGWLDRLFTARKTNLQGILDYKHLLPVRKSYKENLLDDFNFSMERFPNQEALAKYCREVLKPKYAYNQVKCWYDKNLTRYSTSQQQPTPGAVYAGGDRDNERAAALAQNAIANLNKQFTKGR